MTAIAALIGPVADAALHREEPLPAMRATATAGSAAATLFRCFMLGLPVSTVDLAAALPQCGVAGAEALGLIARGASRKDECTAAIDLRPYAAVDDDSGIEWWLASDLSETATGRPLAPDHVLGAGGASLTLAGITSRSRVCRTLDLGTGCGIQALHAARHSERVIATDISARALNFAAFNLAINEVDNVELRLGSMFEPVAGERFDLIVSNPPFVITPRADSAIPDYEYRDAGRSADGLVQELVEAAGGFLTPGGSAQFLMNWEHRRGSTWRERVEGWLTRSGTDAWIVQREVLDVAEYAQTWLRDGGLTADRDRAQWRRALSAYLDDFEQRGVAAVGMGFALLHRPATDRATWRRLIEYPGAVTQPLGPAIAASVAAQEWLTVTSDEELLALRFAVTSDVTEERYFRPGSADPAVIMLRQGGGFGHHLQVATSVAALVGACDGELSLGQLLGAIAALSDRAVPEVIAEALPAVRGLVIDGLLVRA